MDNDISWQNVEESLRGTDESQDSEKEIAQSPKDVIEETGDSWLQQASENKARSRAPRMENINFDAQVSVTNTLQESENKQKMSTVSIYLKPTTMRGIPLASLIPSPIMRGFYITKSENNLPSSILMDNSTSSYMTDIPVEQQTEITLISDISTTDKTVTVAHNDQIESGPNILDDNLNIVNDKGINSYEEKYSTPSSSMIFSKDSSNAENLSTHEKSNLLTIPTIRPASKRRTSLHYDHTTPISNSYVVSSTTPTKRKIAHVVNKYNEAITPLWTGRRIVAKKRNRTTASPIKDVIRRTESAITSTLSAAKSASTLTSRRRKLPTTSTIPSIMADSKASLELLNVHNNFANSDNTEDSKSHATEEAAATSTNSVIAATSLTSKTIPMTNNPIIVDISTFSDDATTMVPLVITDVTSAITSIELETTSLNDSVTDNPTIENTNAILTDSTAAIPFIAGIQSEISPTNVNIVSETVQTIATDSVTESAVTEIETTSTMTNYSTITIPDIANVQESSIDSANTTAQITNTDVTSITVNYSAITIPTTINMHDVITDATSITTVNAEVEMTSLIGKDSTFTTVIENTTIPSAVTTSPTTVISSTVDMQHVHATAPMTMNNIANTNIVTTNMITTTMPLSVIIPIITDLNAITSVNSNIPSTSISETSSTTVQPKTSSVTSSETPITSTIVTLANSTASPTLTTEFSTISVTNPNNLDVSSNSEISAVTTTTESTQTTEIPTTFENPSIFTSTATTFPKPLHSTNFESSPIITVASTQEDKSFFTEVTQTPSIATSITNKATVALERFTTSATPSLIFGKSITTKPTIRATTNTYDVDSVRTISEESTIPERKIGFKEATLTETQNQTEDQRSTTINNSNSIRTMNEKFTTSEMKTVFEEVTSKTIRNRKQNQTTSELDTTNYQFNQKTARRRVLNRTKNWLGSPLTLQRTNQYPRVTYRGQSRRPPSYITPSKVIEKNHRRRVMQKRIRLINSETFNNTTKPDQDAVDVQNTTEDHIAHDRMENVRRMKVVIKKIKERIEDETTTILPTEETTVFLQSSIAFKNETLQIHHENGNIEEKQTIMLKKIKQSQDNFTTKETTTNSSSSNESLSDNSQNNNVTENLSELERPKQIMKTIFENVRSQSEEKNPIEEANIDSDSISTNLQNNFSKNLYADKNLSDKRITGRRMRVVLKSVRPKSEEKNSTIEETNVKLDSTGENLQNNFSNNINVSQTFSNKEKTKRRMRVILKRVKSESDERGTKSAEASTEYDDTNESLQGTFSNNFYSAKNFPTEYGARRRMRVERVLKSVKPKSEEKNLTIEKTTVDSSSNNKNLQGTFLNNFRSDKNFSVEHRTKRRMRVVLKGVKLKSEKGNSTTKERSVNTDSIDKNFQNVSLNTSHRGKNLSVEYRSRRRMRVLKSIKPKSEERDSTIEETSVESESIDEDLQGSFSSNLHMHENLPDEEEIRRGTEVASKSVKSKSKERDSVAEETDSARKDPQVLYTFHFSSNLHVDDNLLDKKKNHSKPEEKETMTEWPENTEPQIMRTSVPVEEDTDQPSLEVSAALSRRSTLS